MGKIDGHLPSNKAVKLSVRPVTAVAGARTVPVRPAAYGRRWPPQNKGTAMQYKTRLTRVPLFAVSLLLLFVGPPTRPTEASTPATANTTRSVVPGQTLGSPLLQRDTMDQLLSSDRIAAPDCRQRTIINTEVLEKVDGDSWKERWSLDRCGKIIHYEIRYTADGKGGTSFTFLVGGVPETPKKSASESTRLDADLIQETLAGDLTRIARLLEEGASLEAVDKHGRTPLKIAADKGAAATVAFLLDKGTDVNVMSDGESPLHSAALRGNQDVVRVLLDRGGNPNQRDANDKTPLFSAVVNGDAEVITMLLVHGADINARMKPNAIGQTPLMWAANGGKSETVTLLLSRGADAKARGDDKKTVLGSISLWCLSADVLEELLEQGAYDQAEVKMAFLVGSGLHGSCANQESFLDYVTFFMAHGVDVNQQNSYGYTALILASIWGYADGVTLLLSKGADASIRDREGKTALDVAKSSDIRRLLKNAKREKS